MHVEHIKEQKFSGSFFPWAKKIKKTQHCSSGSLPSASILSKIKLTERRQILGSCFHKTECFSGTSNLKLPLFLLLVCMYMCVFFFLLPVLNNKIRPKKKKKIITYIKWKCQSLNRVWLFATPWTPLSMEFSSGVGCHFLYSYVQYSNFRAQSQFLTSTSLTCLTFSKKYCK